MLVPSVVKVRRLVAVVILTLAAGRAGAQVPVRPPADLVKSGVVVGSIRLDGVLNEPAWREAGIIADLTQQSPHPGESTRFRTEVRILVDGATLYFGITSTDPDPDRIAVHTMQRDGNMSGDDTISIVLDTYLDQRTGYLFEINAAGARLDGLISDPNAQAASLDWDGIWDVATRRTATGWSAEIAIPAQTVRFKRSTGRWGFNIQRYVARKLLTMRWTGTTLDANLLDMRRVGVIDGIERLSQGWGLTVSPSGLAKYQVNHQTGNDYTQGQASVDVGYHLTSQLDGVLTVNPDFAEVEADSRQVNLTRFALFLPEKRPFFTDGANFFDFGLDLQEDFVPFYSRRVGLFADQIIPITAGLKAVGREGRLGVGALDVETRNSSGVPGTNLAAGRMTYDLNQSLRVGAIGTHGDPDGQSSNSLLGLDAVWQTATFDSDKNLGFGGWAARSFGDVGPGQTHGWGLKAQYPNDLWDLRASFNEFGDALDPVLGYLPRPGTRQYFAGLAYQPRPSGGTFSEVRQFFFEIYPRVVTDLHGRTETWRVFTAPLNFETQRGDHYEANYAPEFQRIFEPFEISPGVVVPPGDYRFDRFRVQVESSDARPFSAGATVWLGGFYGGQLTQTNAFMKWTDGSGHLQLALNMDNDYGHLPEGDFTVRLWQLKSVYAFNPSVVLATFFQYDSASEALGMNARMRWTILPGRDLFVVWNRGWTRPISEGNPYLLAPRDDQFVVKLRWTFTQ